MLTILTSLLTCMFGISSMSNQPIVEPHTEIITDFAGNEFKLIEGDGCYEIYSINNVFIEGSKSTNSPFYEIEGDKYYLGPCNYFVSDGTYVTNLFSNEKFFKNDCDGFSYGISPQIQTMSNVKEPDPDRTYIDSNGFILINEANYFKKLKRFPKNWFGECGVIALSELLGYYDTFYNDDFIPNDLQYEAKYYKAKETQAKGTESSKMELDRVELDYLINPATIPFKNTEYINFDEWSEMPGTSYAMRDYIFDNYMETYIGIGAPDIGYPMLDGELKATLKDYMNNNCSNLVSDTEFISGNILYTHQRPKEYISQGLPTLLVLESYESSIGSGKAHVVLGYGYKDDMFLTHFGWFPGTTNGAEVILSSATIYGYFTIKYTGEHKHSSNVMMKNGDVTEYICGCGKVHETKYTIAPNKWGFDERYYFENEGIKTSEYLIDDLVIDTKRLRCGFIEGEYVNLSANRNNAGDSYLELKFNKKIYEIGLDVAFWSDKEWMIKNQGDFAHIEFLDEEGNWINCLDLLEENLPTDRTIPKQIKIHFTNGTKGVRIVAHKETPNTDRNKGRICLGEIELITYN